MGRLGNNLLHRARKIILAAAAGLALTGPLVLGPATGIRAAPGPDEDPIFAAQAAVSIITDQQMDFGQLADKNGSVTLGLVDVITADPDLIHYGGSPYSGIYTITGDPSTAVDISISAAPSNGFSLDTFVSSEGAIPLVGVLLGPGGELVLTIGATLTVNAATANIGPGQNVSFTITSTYN